MGKVFFIADTHFGDSNIIKFENRPFSSVEQMNSELIANWNKVVDKEDTVFVIGDFISDVSIMNSILTQLKGNIKLIVGNHDVPLIDEYAAYSNVEVIRYPIIFKDFWMLSHQPLYISMNMPYANIYGHIHNNPSYKTVSPRSFCVSAERINYTPVEFVEITKAVLAEQAKV